MEQPRLLHFNSHTDARGQLVALEAMREIPFDVKRVYYMSRMVSGTPRGFHAHRDLNQVAICLAGSCTFIVDNGRQRTSFELTQPDTGLLIGNYIWREMHNFSNDCVLMVLASNYYSENDYIRDYDQFIAEVNSREE